jgi:hypothetical protein
VGKYSTSLKRKDVFHLDFDGKKLADKIEAAGKSIKPAIEAAARRSLPLIQKEFENFASQHERTGMMDDSLIDASQTEFIWGKDAKKRFVGATKKGVKGFSGGSVKVVNEEDCLFFEYGFDANAGGIRALWLDIGTPKRPPRKKGGNTGAIKPSHFIFYAVENNLGSIHEIQKEELTKILEGLK